MQPITVDSKAHEQVIDITDDVAAELNGRGDGLCSLFLRHTTAALTVITNEAGIAADFLSVLHRLVPQDATYVHDSAGHVRAHVLAALLGPSLSLPVHNGRLGLGEFQRIVLVELEGPRERSVEVSFISTAAD